MLLLVPAVALAGTPGVALPAEASPGVVVRTILGLVALMALAAIGGHPRMMALEERLGIRQIIAAGLPFVALGLVARSSWVGVLTDDVLDSLAPLLRMGLGWIGFVLGFRFNAQLFDRLPRGAGRAIAMWTALPFAMIILVIGLMLFGTQLFAGAPLNDPEFVRDALILGSAGAMTAESVASGLFAPTDARVGDLRRMIQVEELAGVVGLAVLAAFFRPGQAATWALPGAGWLFVTLGLGTTLGLLAYAVVRVRASPSAAIVQLLGCVAFASGSASALRLSPIVICFLAGAIVANLPGDYRERVRDALGRVERPLYLVFLVVVGALWNWRDPLGWWLLLGFVPARLAGKWLGTWLAGPGPLALDRAQRRGLALAPMGALSVAIVVNTQVLYPHSTVPALVTAVVVGAWITEILVKLGERAREAVAW